MRSLNEWSTAWRANGWRLKSKKAVKNRDLIEPLVLEGVDAGHVFEFVGRASNRDAHDLAAKGVAKIGAE